MIYRFQETDKAFPFFYNYVVLILLQQKDTNYEKKTKC